MLNFIPKEQAFGGGRAGFANRVCKALFNNCGNNLDKALKDIEPIYEDFFENVRNIYEAKIPLFALYELIKDGADNYGFTEEEYKVGKDNTKKACYEYYIDDHNCSFTEKVFKPLPFFLP